MVKKIKYFFSGIGGSGMSAIAQVLRFMGYTVFGSDRSHDRGENNPMFRQLEEQGILLFRQDGSGVDSSIDELVVSSAIENNNPDVLRAKKLGVPISKRAKILATLANHRFGIAVGGTSGKSTVTAMIGHILNFSGKNPTVINGGIMGNGIQPPSLGNAVMGSENLIVYEADESDGTIVLYEPEIAVLNNVSRDHKSLEELSILFRQFILKARTAIILNTNCMTYLPPDPGNIEVITFSEGESGSRFSAQSIELKEDTTLFVVDKVKFILPLAGRHNVMNAMAAISASQAMGIPLKDCSDSLTGFKGVSRRMQAVGEYNGIRVIDDFAHNPDKIYATLSTLKNRGRLLVMYQPHGFAATRFSKNELIETFSEILNPDDLLFMPEIFYAGGTVERSISSANLISSIAESGIHARFIPDRLELSKELVNSARPGDTIVIMGARDPSLSEFAKYILNQLSLEMPIDFCVGPVHENH